MSVAHGQNLIKHPSFYRTVAVMFFQVESTLFKVDIGSLQEYADAIKEIFSIPPTGPIDEGTESRPIIIQGITATQMDAFLTWLWHIEWRPVPPEEDILVAILHISHMWLVKSGENYAVHHIKNLGLHPARMVELGVRYDVAHWIEAAIPMLLNTPMRQLSDCHMAQLGIKIIGVITKAQETLEEHRKRLAHYPPPLNNYVPDCSTHTTCKHVWHDVWWKTIARAILHPKEPCRLNDCLDLIRNTSFSTMKDMCKAAAIVSIQESGSFAVEGQVTQRAIDSILEHYGLKKVDTTLA
ncbi:hypothetical protein HGRIS_010487 [Hohenbuehelia grisea]|uniref:Uncharacterized protein n=1 Tax=Hohenbuehelia grisea TaxID=104357 RepID=A0ABR3IZN4_9AGAR